MKIQTKRLDIFNLDAKRWKEFYLCRDQIELFFGLEHSPKLFETQFEREYIQLLPNLIRMAERNDRYFDWYTQWIIVEREKKMIVGCFQFLGPPRRKGVFFAFFGALDADIAKECYMEEALRALLAWLFTQKEIDYVECETQRFAFEEIRILEKIGFSRIEQGKKGIPWMYRRRSFF